MRASRPKIISMTDKAYTRLLMSIVTIEFPPGERLSLNDLMARFKIGRTPLREALIKLESLGLVEMHRRKSILVSNITLQGVKSFFEIYQALERLVSRLAAERAGAEEVMRLKRANAQMRSSFDKKDFYEMTKWNIDFHQTIAEASRNAYLISIMKFVYLNSQRLSYISYSAHNQELNHELYSQDIVKILEQHTEIISFIENRQYAELEQKVGEHVRTFQSRLFKYLQGSDSYESTGSFG